MIAPDEAYPLSWPVGWKRCPGPQRARFGVVRKHETYFWNTRRGLSVAESRTRLLEELGRIKADAVVVSTNIRTRGDGLPYSNAAEPDDSGVAVYFRFRGQPRVLACDKWDRVADNMAALAKHIEAMRGQERWGVGSLEQAFGGYLALTAMGASKHWSEVLGCDQEGATPEIVEGRRRALLLKHHPDRGGSNARAAEINEAADQAQRELAR